MFISFEGIDGSGKSTQIKLLKEYFHSVSRNVLTTREPGWEDGISGIMRHLILSGKTAPIEKMFLFQADRASLYEKLIKPLTQGGKGFPTQTILICDRGPDSTVAYQAFAMEHASVEWTVEANRIATQGITADVTFLLDLDPRDALPRAKDPNYFEEQGIPFFDRVRKGYLEISKFDNKRVVVINAAASIQEVHEVIKKVLNERFRM